MANGYFVVQNGLQVGPLTIDAASGTIQTSGNVNITGNLGVSSISKNDSSIVINDTGSGSNVTFSIDGVVEHVMTGSLTTLNNALTVNGNIVAAQSTASTSTTTGALVVVGGVGVSGAVNAGGSSSMSTLVATNFTSANAHITGSDTNIGANHDNSLSRINLIVGTAGDITTLVAPNLSSSNIQATAGTVTGLTNLTATTAQATNFSTGNAQIIGTGSYFGTGASLPSAVYSTTGYHTNLSTANLLVANGYFTNLSAANIDAVTNMDAITSIATNFSSGNIVVTGGSVNNVTVGATTPTTGRFTTVTATTVNAGTIGNTGATLTGTISTTTQNSITTMAGLVSLGSNNIDTVAQGNFTITGNLTVQGVNQAIGSQNLTVADSLIELHTYSNLAPLTFDDGRDIGIRMHYYKGADKNAALIWENTSEQLHWYANAVEVSSNISGTLGTMGLGELFVANSAVSTSTATGALRVTGGAGIGGATYIGGVLNVASTSIFSGATNHASGITASTVQAGTIGNASATLTGTLSTAAQTNVTSVGTLTGLTVSGAILPNANLTINVGSTSAWFNTFYGVSTQAKYADLAENYQADKSYTPGTVLMFGGSQEVTVADAETTAVAGVVSTNPAHLMNGQLSGNGVVALALQGRVPCMVIGPVKKGDMLVSAGFGYAKASANPVMGQVIGKALQDYTTPGKAVIEVVVGRM